METVRNYYSITACVNSKTVTTAYCDPKRNEKMLPSLCLGLKHNRARSSMLVGKNGSEPMIGNEGRDGGNL